MSACRFEVQSLCMGLFQSSSAVLEKSLHSCLQHERCKQKENLSQDLQEPETRRPVRGELTRNVKRLKGHLRRYEEK